MYIILQFGNIWAIYEGNTGDSRLLEKREADSLVRQFRIFSGPKFFNAVQFQKINPNRLMKMPETGYVVVRVGAIWTIYEGGKQTPQILEKAIIGDFSAIFPKLMDEQMLNAIAIDVFNPVKLLKLPLLTSAATALKGNNQETGVSDQERAPTAGNKNNGQ